MSTKTTRQHIIFDSRSKRISRKPGDYTQITGFYAYNNASGKDTRFPIISHIISRHKTQIKYMIDVTQPNPCR